MLWIVGCYRFLCNKKAMEVVPTWEGACSHGCLRQRPALAGMGWKVERKGRKEGEGRETRMCRGL